MINGAKKKGGRGIAWSPVEDKQNETGEDMMLWRLGNHPVTKGGGMARGKTIASGGGMARGATMARLGGIVD